jgi:NADPH-dependent 2,4-dienoyl-CoA reductase/sulfur reductase-like enzyme/bacterioferritin-associated ferredoxin
LAAASKLAEYNLKVLLLDENIRLGGQYLRRVPKKLGAYSTDKPEKLKRIGYKLIQDINSKKIRIINRAKVLGIYPGNELFIEEKNKKAYTAKAEIILLATGAREKFLPFKGWTLPGVISAGAAQILMKNSGILPAEKILIGGAGLFLYAVAYDYLHNHGKLISVLDQASLVPKISILPYLFHPMSRLFDSARFLAKIYSSGTPVRHGTQIIEARGENSLEKVVTAQTDGNGIPKNGTEKIYRTNCLAVSYGFTANIELPQQAGCQLGFEKEKGGWIVKTNEELETTVPNIYAAGEINGIGGALKSIREGHFCALSILHRLNKISAADYFHQRHKFSAQRHRHIQFEKKFNTLSKTPDETIKRIPDETVICRCEGIKMGQIKKAILNSCRSPGAIKRAVQIGMGSCQGRTCGPVLYQILSAFINKPGQEIYPFTARLPIKAISIRSLVDNNC